MSLKHKLRQLFWKFGYDIVRFTPSFSDIKSKRLLLKNYNINLIIDIGANTGQFAKKCRNDLVYTNRIISFEPLSSAYNLLRLNANKDKNWDVYNFALGDIDGTMKINIAGNSVSSSLHKMKSTHIKSAPKSKYIGSEYIKIKRLDSIFNDLCISKTKNIFLKIDTQGHEQYVIKGAKNSLSYIDTIQIEMSLVPLYDGELLFFDFLSFMNKKDYTLISLSNVFSDPDSGRLLQVDGIFHRF